MSMRGSFVLEAGLMISLTPQLIVSRESSSIRTYFLMASILALGLSNVRNWYSFCPLFKLCQYILNF
jgi:hypothetical protein